MCHPSNPRTDSQFTKECIMEALLQLMQTKDYDAITITDLTRRAGVSRMSYYRNYHSKDEILTDYMYRIITEYARDLNFSTIRSGFQTYEHILQSLKYLRKYKDYVLCLQKANRSEILLQGLDHYMLTVTNASEKAFSEKCGLYYYSGALYNIFLHWLREGMQEDIETIAQVIYDHVKFHRYDRKETSGNPEPENALPKIHG